MLVGEEVCREKAPGKRSKVVKRFFMAPNFCEKIVYVMLLEIGFDNEVGIFLKCNVKVRSQYRESSIPKQRPFDVNVKAKR